MRTKPEKAKSTSEIVAETAAAFLRSLPEYITRSLRAATLSILGLEEDYGRVRVKDKNNPIMVAITNNATILAREYVDPILSQYLEAVKSDKTFELLIHREFNTAFKAAITELTKQAAQRTAQQFKQAIDTSVQEYVVIKNSIDMNFELSDPTILENALKSALAECQIRTLADKLQDDQQG